MRVFVAAAALTTPLVAEDYLAYVNPLWARRRPRGRIDAVMPESADAATLWLRPGAGLPRHVPGQYVRVGVDVEGVRHWRTYSVTSTPGRRDGRIAITVKAIPGGTVSEHLVRRTRRRRVRAAGAAGGGVRAAGRNRRAAAVRHGRQRDHAGDGILRALGAAGPLGTSLTCTGAVGRRGDLRRRAAPARAPPQRVRAARASRRRARALRPVRDLDALVPDWRAREAWACGPAGLLDALTERYERADVARAAAPRALPPRGARRRDGSRGRPRAVPGQRPGG